MDKVEVRQVDREAAADYFAEVGDEYRANLARKGEYDHSVCVQAFARHRISAIAALGLEIG